MFIALSFIGKLPSYIIECIYQTRLFTDIPIYLIYNDYDSIYIDSIKKYNVHLINYEDVICTKFNEILNHNKHKFYICNNLGDRKELFIRSFERFFILNNLIKKYNLTDCLFMEIDNLIYDDPTIWLNHFQKKELGYMLDSPDRYSSGIIYIKNDYALSKLCDYFINYILTSNPKDRMLSEMIALCNYYNSNNNSENIQILPTFWGNFDNIPKEAYANYNTYNSLFDAAAYGMYLFGWDPVHTNGIIKKYTKSMGSSIDCTKYKFKWEYDNNDRNIPFIWNNDKWLKINNLHIHSKDLKSALSKSIL